MPEYITELKDDEQRRIIVPRDVWNFLKLKKGDFIKVTIEKMTIPNNVNHPHLSATIKPKSSQKYELPCIANSGSEKSGLKPSTN